MKKLEVYNLEFPIGIQKLEICGYIFEAVENYNSVLALMPNYAVTNVTGSHQITATVTIPEKEEKAILPFEKKLTRLYDILLFLSIFKGRNVFVKDWEGEHPITADPRMHAFGAELQLSISLDHKARIKATGEIVESMSTHGIPVWDIEHVALGFDTAIEGVIKHISEKSWSEKYDDGYFIFGYQNMVKWQNIETSFLSAWTIWESIFSIENREWLSGDDLRNIKSETKIAYILNKYFSVELNQQSRQQIKLLTQARNRMVHFGKMHPDVPVSVMKIFVQITDLIIIDTLGLTPSGVLGSFGLFRSFLEIK